MPKKLKHLYKCIDQDHSIIEISFLGFKFVERVFMCVNCNMYYVFFPGARKMRFKFKKKCSDLPLIELGEYLTPRDGPEFPFTDFNFDKLC